MAKNVWRHGQRAPLPTQGGGATKSYGSLLVAKHYYSFACWVRFSAHPPTSPMSNIVVLRQCDRCPRATNCGAGLAMATMVTTASGNGFPQDSLMRRRSEPVTFVGEESLRDELRASAQEASLQTACCGTHLHYCWAMTILVFNGVTVLHWSLPRVPILLFSFSCQFEYQQAQLEVEIENLSWKLERDDSYCRGVSPAKYCTCGGGVGIGDGYFASALDRRTLSL